VAGMGHIRQSRGRPGAAYAGTIRRSGGAAQLLRGRSEHPMLKFLTERQVPAIAALPGPPFNATVPWRRAYRGGCPLLGQAATGVVGAEPRPRY
jgi:hypothetical protein